ncbi:hypothetical protein [Gemmatimonas groenlandica]|uniref:Uncharacterized protein n=1 Tax=Gemmatimonas groenlandica TaxID=2732249 RepID=A0A6M4IMB7_9BACT|nr:hypothetical protein [Gemmatimonas groenlandica]QJR35215.1 hypothetical protein HKW67_06710 [Gemmatimonas groenlandica]
MSYDIGAIGKVEVVVDGRWTLEDLATFSSHLSETYGFVLSLSLDSEVKQFGAAYSRYPFAGGWSYYDFFRDLNLIIGPERQISVRKIQYASLGVIELTGATEPLRQALTIAFQLGVTGVAVQRLSAIVRSISGTIRQVRIDWAAGTDAATNAERNKVQLLRDASATLGAELGFSEEQRQTLSRLTNDSPLLAVKLLLAVARRALKAQRMHSTGKVVKVDVVDRTTPVETEPPV